MKQINGFWILLMVVLSGSTFQTKDNNFVPIKDVNGFKKELKAFSENTKTIQSDFVQEKHLSILDELISSKGSFTFKKENSVRWEYFEPIQYTIVIHEGKFTIKDGERINSYDVNSNLMFKEINNIIVSIISGNLPSDEEFDISFFENPEMYQTKLIPRRKEVGKMLKAIQIYQTKKDLAVVKVRLTESNDDYTLLKFKNTRLNVVIPEETFFFK